VFFIKVSVRGLFRIVSPKRSQIPLALMPHVVKCIEGMGTEQEPEPGFGKGFINQTGIASIR